MGLIKLKDYHFDEETKHNFNLVLKIVKNHFSLNKESLERFEEELKHPTIDEYYFSALEGSSNLRKKWAIERKYRAYIDRGWNLFKQFFYTFYEENEMTYDDFYKGKILINKNEFKLTKALNEFYFNNRDQNEISRSIVANKEKIKEYILDRMQRVGAETLPKKKEIEVVFSMNFADWFLCSSGESWSSCLNLESSYSECFWSGLPGLIVDPNRCMLYVTNGEKKNCYGISKEKMMTRAWGLIDKENKVSIVRWYPNSIFGNKALSNIIDINIKGMGDDLEDSEDSYKSKYSFKPLFNVNEKSLYIYQDGTEFFPGKGEDTLKIKTGSSGFYALNKNYGNIECESLFDYQDGLSDLIDNNMPLHKAERMICCEECGESIYAGEAIQNNSGYYFCETCYAEIYTSCNECGEELLIENSLLDPNENMLCESCFSELYFMCEHCNEPTPIEFSIEVDYEQYCQECHNELFSVCSDCEETIEKDKAHLNHEDEIICEDCIVKWDLVKCNETGKYFFKEDCEYLYAEGVWISSEKLFEIIDKNQLKFEFAA